MDPFVGQIMLWSASFAPRGWAFCHGQLLPISQNSALFSLIGTTYGGDGRTTFALPDLRGRVPVGAGQGPGLTPRPLGSRAGEEKVTLTGAQMPAHTHHAVGSGEPGAHPSPAGHTWGVTGTTTPPSGPYSAGPPNEVMAEGTITSTGGGQPHDNMQPYVGINYIIALQGIYPSRS